MKPIDLLSVVQCLACLVSDSLLISLLWLVDINVNNFISKTSIQQAAFFSEMESSLPECITFFCSYCLQLAIHLLSDGHWHLGLIVPGTFSNVTSKLILGRMIKWSPTIGYPFSHTYAPDGTTVSGDLCFFFTFHCNDWPDQWLVWQCTFYKCTPCGAVWSGEQGFFSASWRKGWTMSLVISGGSFMIPPFTVSHSLQHAWVQFYSSCSNIDLGCRWRSKSPYVTSKTAWQHTM